MTFRSFEKRFVLPLFHKAILYALSFILFLLLPHQVQAEFKDVPNNDLFSPYISSFSEAHLLTGDMKLGKPLGTFRPYDSLNRAELAKFATVTRLAGYHGEDENWPDLSLEALEKLIFGHLKDYLNCEKEACTSIDDKPFIDVPEVNSNCLKNKDLEANCTPWFSKFVYYAVDKGFVKGYKPAFKLLGKPDRYFGPADRIIRLHSIKMMVVDNGNIEAEKDLRYRILEGKAKENGSYTPKCLVGAENMILDLAGGNNEDNQRLLDYVILADRLDFFGNQCQVMTREGANTPQQRAQWLLRPLTRQEAARYFGLSILYPPLYPNYNSDPTLNDAKENKNTLAADEGYKIPPYKKTGIKLNNANLTTQQEAPPKTPEQKPPAVEELIAQEPGCNLNYSVGSISNNAVRFTGTADEQMVKITIENTSAQPWKKDCKFVLTPDASWVNTKAQGRTARGFEWADRIDPLNVSGGTTGIIDASGKKATFELKVKPGSAKRSMQKFAINTSVPNELGESILVYGENPGLTPASRDFKTSLSGVSVREQPMSSSKSLKKIEAANTAIKVTGHAVMGEYVEAYKTYMWYPVEVDGKDGFVLASLLTGEVIEVNLLTNKNCYNSIKTHENKTITLHFTISNGSNESVRSGWETCTRQASAHYAVDRAGNILQVVKDYQTSYHAGDSVINNSSMGIEIINWGRAFDHDGNYTNWNGSPIDTNQIINLSNTAISEFWDDDQNYNQQQDTQVYPDQLLGKGPYWHEYSDAQYDSVLDLIKYLEERFDIPHIVFDREVPNLNLAHPTFQNTNQNGGYPGYGFFYSPSIWDNTLHNSYMNDAYDFYGVNGHHNTAGKYDPGPHLDLSRFHFNNL